MKVLLLVSELEDYAITYANGLARHAEVVLCVPRRQYARLARWVDPRVDLRLLDWPRHSSPGNLRFLASVVRLVRREGPDVIHLLSNNILWLNLALPFWRGIPIVTTVHDVEVHPGDRDTKALPAWATTLAVRQSDALVVHGEGLRRKAAERFGRPLGEIHVLSHPAITRYADLARAEGLAPALRGEGFTLLLFGRIFAYKGLDLLLRAEAALGDRLPGLRIVIAGRGDDPWELRGLMGDPGRYDIRSRFIEDREVAELFLGADAIALPYAEASQSGVLNVAAAFGLPAIATDVGELGATVEGQGMGLVVPPGDAAAMAATILRMAGDAGAREEMARRARAWAEGPNAPEAVGGRALALYRDLLRRRRAGYAERMHPSPGG
ncbi:glycosyltransferase family 4 protein [Rubellimicrobium aerolatum]|uniref:Glycosyltransferase family 4 protein n=1 Tax=Rubellimicrobium aerolatum TaxID=490979 RepID=A0ABW0SEN8_9RHOB|nr:glycosyltransferase family 4 protein [Rubellimicrobium aerolatum]MBP1806804.1 glycosyltransferase involved in cell wall biosynthesis [Rubellimicrobium aerolatum]